MISNAFAVLAEQLNDYFRLAPSRNFEGSGGGTIEPQDDIIAFVNETESRESINFPSKKVTPILINVEEENQLRAADRYARSAPNGEREFVYPDVRINLNILFVANFEDYLDSLYYVGLIIRFFQAKPVFNHQNTPGLSKEIDKLIFELVTLPFSEQNEVWNALRSAYHPSLLYKVKMLVFQDRPGFTGAGTIQTTQTDIDNL